MKEIYQEIIDRWAVNSPVHLTLKTDLYDEAITSHSLIPLLGRKSNHVIGTDVSFEIASEAKRRLTAQYNGWNNAVVSDIKDLAFKSESLDQILSNSTLDHFPDKQDIGTGLKEISRVLRTGGNLIITLDNLANPVIFLRSILPNHLLNRLGITQFYIGKTLSMPKLIQLLESTGFRVLDSAFIVHSPRILAIWAGQWLQNIRNEKTRNFYHWLLRICEHLEKFPTRSFTGYFIAVKAVKDK